MIVKLQTLHAKLRPHLNYVNDNETKALEARMVAYDFQWQSHTYCHGYTSTLWKT